jgi:hypothetical protein
MAVTGDGRSKEVTAKSGRGGHVERIDRNAPAGSEDSLGEESVRDGRPSTDDEVVEAMDEEGEAPER